MKRLSGHVRNGGNQCFPTRGFHTCPSYFVETYDILLAVSFHRGEAPQRWFVTHGAVLGRGIISLEHPFLKYIAAVNRMKHRICLLESWKGAYHTVCCIVNLSSMRPDKNKLDT